MAKILFPQSFHLYAGRNTKPIDDKEINEYVKEVKKALKRQEKETPDEYSPFITGSGNAVVIGWREDDGFRNIVVAKNYYEATYVPGEGWLDESENLD